MHLRFHTRILLVSVWILALFSIAPAQAKRRSAQAPAGKAPATTNSDDRAIISLKRNEPKGWVWVTQTIDLTQQFGGEENIMTLDGEPLPSMQRKRITLGLVLDEEGHVVTRLIDVTPSRPPIDVQVRALDTRPTTARFIGLDTVTGLSVLKVEGVKLEPANFSTPARMPLSLNIKLYGFHPNQGQSLQSSLTLGSPRRNYYQGRITRATRDFRYNSENQIYHLMSPQLTPVQDCSLILERNNSVFGIAIYDTGSQGPHLVYPITRVRTIVSTIISANRSLAHGWLGATGIDAAPTLPTATSKPSTADLGVRITAVAPDSPADKAGMKARDILLGINDRRVQTYAQLATLIRQIPANSQITLQVKRGNEYKVFKATLIPAPATEPEQQLIAFARRLETMEEELRSMPQDDPNRQNFESRVGMMRVFVGAVTRPAPPEIRLRVFYGLEVQSLTGQLMNYFAVTNGLLVTRVIENGKAAASGLSAGDVITRIGESTIINLQDLINALDRIPPDQPAAGEITVLRRRESVKLHFRR
ncbi:MAG: PDZ domain-containing protein [Acidobacteriota bacterium]|nr:MAG: PDZ domain-containing protein [Acidobacteriota bacterium]